MNPIRIHILIATLTFTLSATAWSQTMTDTYTKPAGWKTWCVGRFLIDLPPTAKYAGGRYEYDYTQYRATQIGLESFTEAVRGKEAALAAKSHQKDHSLLRKALHPAENTHVLAFWEHDFSSVLIELEGYRWINGTQFLLTTEFEPSVETLATRLMVDQLSKLAYRRPEEIPEGPGFCINQGFISDDGEKYESLMVSFQWADKPDITLSIMMSTNGDKVDTDTLLSRRPGALSMLGAAVSRVQNLREGQKNLREQLGEEWLLKAPNAGGHPAHLFAWEGNGKPNSSASPDIRIDFHTAERDQNGNELSSSLTDKQALALWDQILASLRPRPTGPAKTSAAEPTPNDDDTAKLLPLGTKVSSAANCPQSGIWQCAPDAPGITEHRRYLQQGQPMPYGQTQAPKPGFAGFLGTKEDQPVEVVWTLAAYEQNKS